MTSENVEPRKRFLALDTSTATLGVAVTEGGVVLHEINASGERNHSVHLLPIIQQALTASGTDPASLAGISVGVGPGSYTGTRIAVTAAKTLAWAWKLPVAGVSSLHALAWGGWQAGLAGEAAANRQNNAGSDVDAGVPAESGAGTYGPDWIIPLLDARRGQAYTALFAAADSGAPVRLEPDAIRLMADWVQRLGERLEEAAATGTKPRRLWFVGETALHASEDSLRPLQEAASLEAVPYELEGRWAGLLGEARLAQGERDDLHSIIPNYTQLSEAEANLQLSREGSINKR
ncbi:tRNA (adenosine(37)-N6)-threonylcarbamoyltransferase complex dimerization subunit type 1 TsaB [Paenibacillus agri]|uniref:tRNA (Adenosine(37)-N6)-threonylcarbamoyltransferase complex dimerization subunit type 1 TsaB n=1 Tax=Paenibacillus agri TaxID=2744309 RepID=A0A850ESL9_9BACL|nr:tRNA (adenosine(37)-N6)-threonylcarbamoyltransferase complex dimerization subunit type 1 TsaB [Paenibacillus agri]NUU63546.1 tRNA (adenosine(37)-N6)-threonylcarbamoyltransferase complex dimerization subunit type 1 TsaB [Paenibacillus agri]